MDKRFMLALTAVIAVGLGIGAGAGALLSGKGNSAVASSANVTSQQSQSRTDSPSQSQTAVPQAGRQQGGSAGTVIEVSGSGFTMSSQNTKVQVVINNSSKITKTVGVKIADFKIGDQVVASGSQQEDGILLASSVQVGGVGFPQGFSGGFPDATGQNGQGGQRGLNQGGQTQGGQNQGGPGQSNPNSQATRTPRLTVTMMTGSIESMSEDVLSVKTPSGSTSKVKVSTETTMRKAVEGALSDIKTGLTAIVAGKRNDGGSIVATSVQIAATE